MSREKLRPLILFLVAPIFLLVVIVIGINRFLYIWEDENIKTRQTTLLSDAVNSITAEINNATFAASSIKSLWISSDNVAYKDFTMFSNEQLESLEGQNKTISLGWVDTDNIIKYIYPQNEVNSKLINLDTNHYLYRISAIEHARTTKELAVTYPFNVAQGYPGVVLYDPIYLNGSYNGCSFAVIKLSDLTRNVASEIKNSEVQIYTDNSIFRLGGDAIYDFSGKIIPTANTNDSIAQTIIPIKGQDGVISRELKFADKTWVMYYRLTDSVEAGGVSLLYILITSLFSVPVGFLLIVNYRGRLRIERLYLQESNLRKELEQDVEQRQRYEVKINEQYEQLQKSKESEDARNHELEELNKIMLGREMKMIELKKQLEEYQRRKEQ